MGAPPKHASTPATKTKDRAGAMSKRDRKSAYYNINDLGSKGRRSGIEISKNLRRDEHGMEDLDDYFNEEDEQDIPSRGSKSKSGNRTIDSSRSMDTTSKRSASSAVRSSERGSSKNTTPVKRKEVGKRTPAHRSKMAMEDDDALVREPSPEMSDEEEADMEVDTPPRKSHSRSEPPQESEEEEEEEDEDEETSRKPAPKSRNTAAAPSPRAQKQSPVAKKKAAPSPQKKTAAAKAKPKVSASAAKKTAAAKTPDVQAPRRSSRRKIPPLAFWRNEKIVYELDHEHHRPQIKDIVFHEEKPEERPARKRATKKSAKRAKRQKLDEESEESDQDVPEWEKNDYVETEVFEYPDTDERTKRLVAWAPGHEPFRDIKNSSYRLATLYDRDSGFSAAGVISLQPNGQKPMKPSKQNSYIFFVIKGRVEVNVSDATFTLRKGGSFEVPRGNYYSITNVHPGETRLFFTQSTDTLVNQELEAAMEEDE